MICFSPGGRSGTKYLHNPMIATMSRLRPSRQLARSSSLQVYKFWLLNICAAAETCLMRAVLGACAQADQVDFQDQPLLSRKSHFVGCCLIALSSPLPSGHLSNMFARWDTEIIPWFHHKVSPQSECQNLGQLLLPASTGCDTTGSGVEPDRPGIQGCAPERKRLFC